jgi:anthranilate phosphoribosyltransferase
VPPEDFSRFIAALGRGPGRSRALTRDEAREAFTAILAGAIDPHQVGAFLMLLRYRGEDAAEVTGLVEAARARLPSLPSVALDWPSYGAGRTRSAPWFLLAALALGQAGIRVLMHGSNTFGAAMPVAAALATLGLAPARDADDAARTLDRIGFAYLPIAQLSPEIAHLLELRRLFGLRSPVNTVARLLDPAGAPAGVGGVFHPGYIDVHLGVAQLLGRPRLLVLKGGGGEAERVPSKPATAHLWAMGVGRTEIALPPIAGMAPRHGDIAAEPDRFAKVWRGDAAPERELATIQATIALALLAVGRMVEAEAAYNAATRIWAARRPVPRRLHQP